MQAGLFALCCNPPVAGAFPAYKLPAMALTCNCFGMASAARVPVKRYNLLVPDVFPVVEPTFGKPLGITVERKIKKLAEYLEKNEHRAPKVGGRCAGWRLGDVGREGFH